MSAKSRSATDWLVEPGPSWPPEASCVSTISSVPEATDQGRDVLGAPAVMDLGLQQMQ